jgi:hypothetical protein
MFWFKHFISTENGLGMHDHHFNSLVEFIHAAWSTSIYYIKFPLPQELLTHAVAGLIAYTFCVPIAKAFPITLYIACLVYIMVTI